MLDPRLELRAGLGRDNSPQLDFRTKAKDGSYVNERDKERESAMIEYFVSCTPNVTYIPTESKFAHADGELHRDGKVVGLVEAKYRDRFDRNQPSHCLQIGMEKIVGIYDKYNPDWKDQGIVKPIILLSEIYKDINNPDLGTDVYAVSLSAFNPWLILQAYAWSKTPKYTGVLRVSGCPHISWVENKYSDKGHGHYCLWIPLSWCSKVEPGFDIASGIKSQRLEVRKKYVGDKYWRHESQPV